jgi:quercetin dioxygenase-like cupin family protein
MWMKHNGPSDLAQDRVRHATDQPGLSAGPQLVLAKLPETAKNDEELAARLVPFRGRRFVRSDPCGSRRDRPGAKVSVVFDQELPNVPGKSMRAVLVEYAPGAGSPSHRHPTSAFIYARVLEGAIRSKVNDGPERTYQTGESWVEKPGDHHQVSKNASATEPARLLAIFVVDTSDVQIVIPDK